MLSVCASSYEQVYRPSIHLKGRQHGIEFAEAVIDLLIDLRPDLSMLVVSPHVHTCQFICPESEVTRVLVQLLDRRMHFKQQEQGVMSKSDGQGAYNSLRIWPPGDAVLRRVAPRC
jgi:hypothetical protein